ncbi:MAG: hypothetical protein LBF59_07510 [Prevotellaceae bacterium]|nr:hypothetical protein [Prevotellaceae bacterium]
MYGEGSLNWNNKFADKHEVSMMTVFTIRDYIVFVRKLTMFKSIAIYTQKKFRNFSSA